MNLLNDDEIPVGLGMALAENLDAMNHFSNMDEASRNAFIERSRHVRSKREMQSLVADLNTMH